ncbi:MAG: diacylglycerol kinase family protein [Bacteroidetes bacterium]|nr:diacylglycerol kinase family protein [Bacteroidota bacterium]
MENRRFSLMHQMKSFRYAFAGIRQLVLSEHNARIHLTATIAVIAMSLVFSVTKVEAIFITASIGFVWVAELFNTAIEKTMDFITKEKHPEIKLIKDFAAGAVLIASVTALIIGLIIFIPKIV